MFSNVTNTYFNFSVTFILSSANAFNLNQSKILSFRERLTSKILYLYFFLIQDEVLWSCLAAMSSYAKELNTAEVAYAAIQEVLSMLLGCKVKFEPYSMKRGFIASQFCRISSKSSLTL